MLIQLNMLEKSFTKMLKNGLKNQEKSTKDTKRLLIMIFKTSTMILLDQAIQEALNSQTLIKLLNTGEMRFKLIKILDMKSLTIFKNINKILEFQKKDLDKKLELLGKKKLKITTIQLELLFKSFKHQLLLKLRLKSQLLLLLMLRQIK